MDLRASLAAGIASGGKDTELASQSEVQFVPTTDQRQVADIKKLTGIDTQPYGMIVLTTFWFKHAMEFGKLVAVIQPHPADKHKSILTGFTVMAIEKKHWNAAVRKILLGEVGYPVNGQSGLSMGVPKVTELVFMSLTKILQAKQEANNK